MTRSRAGIELKNFTTQSSIGIHQDILAGSELMNITACSLVEYIMTVNQELHQINYNCRAGILLINFTKIVVSNKPCMSVIELINFSGGRGLFVY